MKFRASLSFLSAIVLPAFATAVPVTYRVTQNVGSLSQANPASVDNFLHLSFQLTDGTNAGNGTTRVTLSNLGLTGGSFGTALADIGNVSYGPGSFTLEDGFGAGYELADHTFEFRVDSSSAILSYDFTVETTGYEAPTPDGFNVAILDFDLSVVRTLGPTGNEFVNYSLTGSPTSMPLGYGVDPTFAASHRALGDMRFDGLGTPTIAAVPEPTTLLVTAVGLAFVARHRKSSIQAE